MPPEIFIFIGIGVVVFLSFYFSKKNRIKRKLKKAPLLSIGNFKHGQVAKIQGHVAPYEKTLTAPLSGRACSSFSVLVEEKRSSGKNSYWKTIIEDNQTSGYVIQEGEHFAIIKQRKIKSHILLDREYNSGTFNDATDTLKNYLREHGHESEGFLGFNKTIRYREGILEVGEKIAVYGLGKWQNGMDLGLPEEYDKVLEIDAPTDDSIYLSDDPSTITMPTPINKKRTSITT